MAACADTCASVADALQRAVQDLGDEAYEYSYMHVMAARDYPRHAGPALGGSQAWYTCPRLGSVRRVWSTFVTLCWGLLMLPFGLEGLLVVAYG